MKGNVIQMYGRANTGSTVETGTPSPEIEALILVAMTVVSVWVARVMLRKLEWLARHEGRLGVRGG